MPRFLDDLRDLLRDNASSLRDEARALGDIVVDVGRYAAQRLGRHSPPEREQVDPLREVLDRMIVQVAHLFLELKKATAVAIADEKHLERRAEQEAANAAEWGRRAELAERAGDPSIVREARARQEEHAGLARLLHARWEQQRAAVIRHKDELRAINDRLERLKRDKSAVLLRRSAAQGRRRLRVQLDEIDEALRMIERMTALGEEPDVSSGGQAGGPSS